MNTPTALQAFVQLYRIYRDRWIATTDQDENGNIVRSPIPLDPAVKQQLMRHMWTYHPNDAMGYSEFVRRAILMAEALAETPMMSFGEGWKRLQNKANDFFLPGACAESWHEIGVHAQEVVHFMEAATIIVDEVPLDAIERIVERPPAYAWEQFRDDIAVTRKWLAAVKAARAIMTEVEEA